MGTQVWLCEGLSKPSLLLQEQGSLPLFCHDLSDTVWATQAAFLHAAGESPVFCFAVNVQTPVNTDDGRLLMMKKQMTTPWLSWETYTIGWGCFYVRGLVRDLSVEDSPMRDAFFLTLLNKLWSSFASQHSQFISLCDFFPLSKSALHSFENNETHLRCVF